MTSRFDRRTIDQNRLMWSLLSDLSRQVRWLVNGRETLMTPDDWKDVLTAAFKRETVRLAMGLDGGVVMLGQRTSKFTKAELKELTNDGLTYKQTAAALQQQRQAIEQERQIAQQITQLAPQVEAIRAEGRILRQLMDGLNQEVQALTESDPIAAMQKKLQLDQLYGRFQQLAQAEQQVSGAMTQMQVQALSQQIAQEVARQLQLLASQRR